MSMKTFKNYLGESSDVESFYVRVQGGKIILCTPAGIGPCGSYGSNIANAVVQGDYIVATTNDGKTQLWLINRNSHSASLVKST